MRRKILFLVLFILLVISVYIASDHYYGKKKQQEFDALRLRYEADIRHEKDWVLKNQGEHGEIYINITDDNGAREVNPYFACQAVMGLLVEPCRQKDIEAAGRYLNWHTEQIINCDGIVSNYRFSKSQDELLATGEYDSVDSYIALYLESLALFAERQGDLSEIKNSELAIDICLTRLEDLMQNGLCRVKPEREKIYLMDNAEVLAALKRLSAVMPDNERIADLAKEIALSIDERLWDSQENRYEIGIADSTGKRFEFDGMDNFYPDAIVQIFPIACDMNYKSREAKEQLYALFCDNFAWERETTTTFEWPVVAYIAVKMGDIDRAEQYLAYFGGKYAADGSRDYPFYVGVSGWLIRAEGEYVDYMKNKAATSLFEDIMSFVRELNR